MQGLRTRTARLTAIAAVGIAAIVTAVLPAEAQNPQVEEKLTALKQSIAANKRLHVRPLLAGRGASLDS